MRVLALDQSTSTTGVAIGDSKADIRSYRITSIKVPKREQFGERLFYLVEKIDALIRAHEPDAVFYEAPVLMLHGAGGINQQKFAPRSGFIEAEEVTPARKEPHVFSADVMMKLQKVAGCVEMIAAAHGLPCESVVAASWRSTALGMGRAPKDAPDGFFKTAMVRRAKQLGYSPKDDNEADALGILIHAFHGPDAAKRNQGDLLMLAGAKL